MQTVILSQNIYSQVNKTPTEIPQQTIESFRTYNSYNLKQFFISNVVLQKFSVLQLLLHKGSPVVLLQSTFISLVFVNTETCFITCFTTLQLTDCCITKASADSVLVLGTTERALGMIQGHSNIFFPFVFWKWCKKQFLVLIMKA